MSDYKTCVEGCEIPSKPTELEILVRQLKKDVKKLMNDTEAKLLCHDRKDSRAL